MNKNVEKKKHKASLSNLYPLYKVNNKGYSRKTNGVYDFLIHHYILKFVKKHNLDGFKEIIQGYKNDSKTSSANTEYVFASQDANSLFKRVDEIPELSYELIPEMEICKRGFALAGK